MFYHPEVAPADKLRHMNRFKPELINGGLNLGGGGWWRLRKEARRRREIAEEIVLVQENLVSACIFVRELIALNSVRFKELKSTLMPPLNQTNR